MNSDDNFKKIFAQLNAIEKIVARTDSELRIVKKKMNVMSKRISNIEKHLSVKLKATGKKRANFNDMTFTCSYENKILQIPNDYTSRQIKMQCSFWTDKQAKPGYILWGKRIQQVPRHRPPYFFTEFVRSHFNSQHNHIVYLASNRFYLYQKGHYTQQRPTKAAIKKYTGRLIDLFYFCMQHRTKQPEQAKHLLQDYSNQGITDQAVAYVTNYLLNIKDKLQNSYNLVTKPDENSQKNV